MRYQSESKRGLASSHIELTGADAHIRYRQRRFDADSLRGPLRMRFRFENEESSAPLLDVAPSGTQIEAPESVPLLPGAALSDAVILLGEEVVWEGEAEVVWVRGQRVGLRFIRSLLDTARLIPNEPAGRRLAEADNQAILELNRVPVAWRSIVDSLRLRLAAAKSRLESLESDEMQPSEIQALIASYADVWAPPFVELVEKLQVVSKNLKGRQRVLAERYAARQLLSYYVASPIPRRAYEKPLGYAGDYRVMMMFISRELLGDTLFAKFMSQLVRQTTLGRAVVSRTRLLRQQFRSLRNRDRPIRVVSLACGPGYEVADFMSDADSAQDYQFSLVDQDEEALEVADRSLQEALLGKPPGRVSARLYHFSVIQILRPQSEQERVAAKRIFQDADLIYTSGLYDYLENKFAKSLTEKLYDFLAPGGKLLVGNMVEAPDISWVMDYVVDWKLIYRSDTEVLDWASAIPAEDKRVISEDTGHCIFLSLKKPVGVAA